MATNYEREKRDYIKLDISSDGAIVLEHTARDGLRTTCNYNYFGEVGARSASDDLIMKTDTAIVDSRLEDAPLLRINHIAIEESLNAKAAETEFDQPQA